MSRIENSLFRAQAEAAAPPQEPATGIRWDLDYIYPSFESARSALDQVLADAAHFESRYRGRVANLEGEDLASALEQLGTIRNTFGRIESFADLRFSIDSRDSDTKDLLDVCARANEDIQNRLRFFDLEWQALGGQTARERSSNGNVAPFRHTLDRLTAYAPHMRSESEEAMLAARETAAVSEWQKLFGENIDKIEVEFDAGKGGSPHTLDRLFAYARHPNRDVRFAAFETAYAQLKPRVDVQAACYNAIVGDRLQMDRVRGFQTPMQATNLMNDLPDAVVDNLVDSVKQRYHIVQRWLRIKARLLGLPKLHVFDQLAPLGMPKEVGWETAWNVFQSGTRQFSDEVDGMLAPLLADRRIDAEPRPGKRGGAFCSPVAWGLKPYILMNFTDDTRSIETLAHEAGHALHFVLTGRNQPPLSASMGLAMAEVASTFHETVLVDYMLEHEADPDQRRILTAGQIEGAFGTVFRQIMMTGYEQRAYALKASGRALTAERLSEIWFEESQAYFDDAIELPDDIRLGWSYIPHFIFTRFYTYAYSFAHLASMALYAKYREVGPGFIPTYLEILGAGGSQTPQELLGSAGIDITNPDWVNPSFAQIERLIDIAEAAG